MLAPILGEVISRHCPHCGEPRLGNIKWAYECEDGIGCIFCGCVLYKGKPLDDFRGYGGRVKSPSDGRLKKNRRVN